MRSHIEQVTGNPRIRYGTIRSALSAEFVICSARKVVSESRRTVILELIYFIAKAAAFVRESAGREP
jgi:hypothetical protein